MNRLHEALVALLADGALHSAADLSRTLGVSGAVLQRLVDELREHGVPVESRPDSDYCLPGPVELLDVALIAHRLAALGWRLGQRLEVLFETDSTNVRLNEAPAPAPHEPRVLFAELQQAGRGRRGRSWLAPFGSGLTLSVAWTFAESPPGLQALGLAVGAGVAEALRRAGAADVQVKWPNDLVWHGRKLGGLLLQLRSETGGPASVVAGLGLNLELPPPARAQLDVQGAQPTTDLREAMGGRLPGRNDLAATASAALLDTLTEFARAGFAPFAARWKALDALAGAQVRVTHADGAIEGEACGTDADGALLVRVDGTVRRFHSGDVSLRAAAQ
jgi:BirA family biotin operon repressor/biotin-[acetyl-CoA-carboxylase] ligase